MRLPAFSSVLLGTLGVLLIGAPDAKAALLVGNTEGHNVVLIDERTGNYGGEFIPTTSGYFAPDDLTFGPDGNLYVSWITDPETYEGAILKYDGQTGEFLGRFDQGGELKRPYGLAFGPDGYLYVSSFRSDEIVRYDLDGNFVDVFASGSGAPGGLNGPNDLLFDDQGNLFVTTQGSIASSDGKQVIYPPFLTSQVLKYSADTQTWSVFAEPEAAPGSVFPFVSLLGLTFGPTGDLFVSDFANAIRRYDLLTGQLIDEFSSNLFGFMGNLTFDPEGRLYTPVFNFLNGNIGSVAQFNADLDRETALVSSASFLNRPIGIAYISKTVPEPAVALGLLGLGLWGMMQQKRDRPSTR